LVRELLLGWAGTETTVMTKMKGGLRVYLFLRHTYGDEHVV
jgi:hypothetical protein